MSFSFEYKTKYYAVRGGALKLEKTNNSDHNLYGFSDFGEIVPVNEFYDYPKKVRIESRNSASVYDCAFVACMAFYGHGGNQHSRDMLSWLASSEFKDVWDSVPVSSLCEMDIDSGVTGNRFIDQLIDLSLMCAIKKNIVSVDDKRRARPHAYLDAINIQFNQDSKFTETESREDIF